MGIVILTTDYNNMITSARKVLGDEVADRCSHVWDSGDEA